MQSGAIQPLSQSERSVGAETPPQFVHLPALRLSRFHPVRWGGRGGVAYGTGNCGSVFPSSPAVIGLVAPGGGWDEKLGVSELNTPGSHIQKLGLPE